MNILNQLTIKHLKLNKKRTVVTIIGIILSTALMVGIGLLLSTVRDNYVQEIISNDGNQHVTFQSVPYEKRNLILQNHNVEKTIISSTIGYANLEGSQNEYKPYLKLIKASDDYLQNLKLIEGTLPQNENEIVISDHIATNGGVSYHVGDKIALTLGIRYDLEGEEMTFPHIMYQKGETFQPTSTKEYTITGIVKRDIHESYSDAGYSIFTKEEFHDNDFLTMLVEYKKIKDTYKNTESIAQALGYEKGISNTIQYNDSLLALSGISKYDNMIDSFAGVLIIMLSLVAIGCVIVIYNSFAISVMERKKQFGLFASIGTTRSQIRKTVFFEAFLVGLIGIPLGVLGAYIGIGTVLAVVNYLIPNMFSTPLRLVTYPLFLIIPLIFMVITILLSAYLPAKRASRVTPIEAIRQNDDIKIKRKMKTNRFVNKVFGVEGDIAHKNMQRNKKKYRITTASLVISIVLFVSFSAFMGYMIDGTVSYTGDVDFDIQILYTTENRNDSINHSEEEVKSIVKHDQVDEYLLVKKLYSAITTADVTSMYTDGYTKLFDYNTDTMNILVLDNETFATYLKQIGQNEVKPILYNRFNGLIYKDKTRKSYDIKRYKDIQEIAVCDKNKENEEDFDCYANIKDYYLTTTDFVGYSFFAGDPSLTFIIPESLESIYVKTNKEEFNYDSMAFIRAKKYDKLDEQIEKAIDDKKIDGHYYNITEELTTVKNMVLVVKILVYGFISLVTLIGVTSVFNTISTSIALRRKEFAMLRSMGLTPKGFNKIIRFESLFVGLRALMIGIPISLGITLLLHLSMSGAVSFDTIKIPWMSILIAVIGVFIIILLSMSYSSRKVKKENILEAIREENI